MQQGAAVVENGQTVAPVCQARLGPVVSDPRFLALPSPSCLSPLHPTAAPPPLPKALCQQAGASLWLDPVEPSLSHLVDPVYPQHLTQQTAAPSGRLFLRLPWHRPLQVPPGSWTASLGDISTPNLFRLWSCAKKRVGTLSPPCHALKKSLESLWEPRPLL